MKALRLCALALCIAAAAAASAEEAPPRERVLSDMATLAQAMAILEIDTGYFTTLENLDDLPGTVGAPNEFQGIDDGGGALVIRPARGRFQDDRVNLTTRPPGFQWQGPYVSVQNMEGPGSAYDPGSPQDPWGNPYYLYTPLGRVSPLAEAITLDDYGDSFSTYEIVSFGPDGVMSDDDLFRTIPSAGITEPVISSVRVSVSRGAEYEVQVKGWNFGAGAGSVTVGGEPAAVDSWTPRLVTARISPLPDPGAETALTLADTTVLLFGGYLFQGAPASASGGWTVYE